MNDDDIKYGGVLRTAGTVSMGLDGFYRKNTFNET
jgi:hypothetical protein